MTAQPAFNFDEWKTLAELDPTEFEHRRQQRIETAIEACPDNRQQRLRGLQFRVDMERRRIGSPLGACIRISEMMMEQVRARFHPVLLGTLATSLTTGPSARYCAEVVQLSARKSRPIAER